MDAASLRILKDLKEIVKYPPYGITGSPMNIDDIFIWKAVICGPKKTPWEEVELELEITFPASYPIDPPKIKFLTEMFHPNVYRDGTVCLDIVADNWSPSYGIVPVLQSIQVLLYRPNPNSPANADAAKLYQKGEEEYYLKVSKIIPKFNHGKKL